jgi:hypothetical protein
MQALADEIAGSPLEIKEVAKKALELQRYLLRRAWGAGYAAWSVAIFLTVFGRVVATLLGFSSEYTVDDRAAVGLLASGAALTIILVAFKRVRDTAEIRNLVASGKWKRVLGYRVLVPLWIGIYVIVATAALVFGLGSGAILAGYAAFWAFLYYALKLSFPDKLPGEAIAALSSFGVATASTIALLPFGSTDAIIGLLWAAMVVTWIASAIYARRLPVSAPEVSPAV